MVSACAVEAPDDTQSPGTGGKGDGDTKIAGDFTKLYFDGGTLTESGTVQIIPLSSGKVRMRLTATDHTVSPAGEGHVVDEDFVFDDENFAESTFGPDCKLTVFYLDGALDVNQYGLCRDFAPEGVVMNGRYKRSYATGEWMSFLGGNDPANAMTLVWMGSKLEFHLGSGEAMAAGKLDNASLTRPNVYKGDNCTLACVWATTAAVRVRCHRRPHPRLVAVRGVAVAMSEHRTLAVRIPDAMAMRVTRPWPSTPRSRSSSPPGRSARSGAMAAGKYGSLGG